MRKTKRGRAKSKRRAREFVLTLEFFIPLTITKELSLNQIYAGVHWNKRKDQKDAICLLTKNALGGKTVKFDAPVCIEMSFCSRLDVSNHAYLFKMIEDTLRGLKIIKDDTDKYVKKVIMSKQNEFKGVVVKVSEAE